MQQGSGVLLPTTDEQDFDFDDDEIDSQGDIDDEDYIDY
ncbi:MAG: hypothetical protein EZS28_043743, partial [Streblomastix strix]